MTHCLKSPTGRHETHPTIPIICQHCRDLLPLLFPRHVDMLPAVGWNCPIDDPDAHLGGVGGE